MPNAQPDEHDVLLEAIRSQLARVHTALPGTVLSYNQADQTATVQPAFKFKYRDADSGEVTHYEPPAISNVPVLFPGSGNYSITWDVAAGESVLLVFCERSLDEWRSVTGSSHEPKDVRRFDLSDAVAFVGCRSPASAIPASGYATGAMVIRAGELRLGSSAATLKVLLETLETDLSTWLTAVTALNAGLQLGTLAGIMAAANVFAPLHATFVAQVAAGHKANKVKAE